MINIGYYNNIFFVLRITMFITFS